MKHKFTHSFPIEKGTQGYLSKIAEELCELTDASLIQNNKSHAFIELADLQYAIFRYSWRQFKCPLAIVFIVALIKQLYQKLWRDRQ